MFRKRCTVLLSLSSPIGGSPHTPTEAEQQMIDRYHRQRKAASASTGSSDGVWYGIPENSQDFTVFTQLGDHRFAVCPLYRTKSDVARNHVATLCGGFPPRITVEHLENQRSRFNSMDKKEKNAMFSALQAVLYEHLSESFKDEKKQYNLNYAEIEKMFFPKYAPKFETALNAFGLKRHRWYVPDVYTSLENICRFPLERIERSGHVSLTFQEWYSLFYNHYISFHPLVYVMEMSHATMIYTEEFVDELADYLRDRCRQMDVTTPILDLHTHNGRLANLLNLTKKIPVPVIPCHPRANPNPYSLLIPRGLQKEFAVPKIEKLTVPDALQKYRPSIVMCQDMPADTDWTREFRSEGSVKEYLLLGIPLTFKSGHMWLTWGSIRHRPDDDKSTIPHHMQAGFEYCLLNHISRWCIDKHDSEVVKGFGGVAAFHKQQYKHSLGKNFKWLGHRLRTGPY